jgi:hypothetical protein
LQSFNELFWGRKLAIATKHGKEQVIAPIFEKRLGVTCYVPSEFDTDLLGTFTGEVERTTPLATAKEKCLRGMSLANCDLGIASEGSFGPHPDYPFIPANEELLLLIDKKNNLEISMQELSIETNFNSQEICTENELIDFANRAKFPEHKVILRKSYAEPTDIIKDISDWEELMKAFSYLSTKHNKVYAETDMRAMRNPMRMKVIEQTAEKLLSKILTGCPACGTPGFGIAAKKDGLPCKLCKSPTRSVLSYIYICLHCQHREEHIFPHHKKTEDPQYCDTCNP